MKINNPKVTLADDARVGVKEELRSGFLDWLHPVRAYCRENSISILPEKSTARPSSTLCETLSLRLENGSSTTPMAMR